MCTHAIRRAGLLQNKQTIAEPRDLAGVTDIELSADGRLAIAVAFQSRTALLYLRDPQTGELKFSDLARDGENGVRMVFPIQGAFTPDSRFVVVLDDAGEGDDGPGALPCTATRPPAS